MKDRATELGVDPNTIYYALSLAKSAPSKPAAKPTSGTPDRDDDEDEINRYARRNTTIIVTDTRAHTNSHACWCRKSPCNTKNPWCKLADPKKPVGTLAGPQMSRVDRLFPRGAR